MIAISAYMINCLTPISNLNRLNYKSKIFRYFLEIQPHLCVRGHFSLSRTVCVFRTYGLKISTTVESVYPYTSVCLNGRRGFCCFNFLHSFFLKFIVCFITVILVWMNAFIQIGEVFVIDYSTLMYCSNLAFDMTSFGIGFA